MATLSAIIYVNSNIGDVALNTLNSQLSIDESMAGAEFDARLAADPNYPTIIHANNLRILVLRPSLQDFPNATIADIVLFVKSGLAYVLRNNLGPPGITLPINKLNLNKLIFAISHQIPVTPTNINDLPAPIKKFLIDPTDPSGAHNANPDNEFTNQDFINRK